MMNKRYKIVITEFTEEEVYIKKTYEKGCGDNPSDPGGNWGYTPQGKEMSAVERKVYVQDLEELDIPAVIKAVNKI